MPQNFRLQTLSIVLAIIFAGHGAAEGIPEPVGPALLSISGDITNTNVDDLLVLDREALMALPATTFETSTIWTDGIHTFTGVSLHNLAAEIGAPRSGFLATAINDYAIEIPADDIVEGGPIIAYLMDGSQMSVRDKGPLWVVYPYDSSAEYRTEVTYSRSIWQLDRLETLE